MMVDTPIERQHSDTISQTRQSLPAGYQLRAARASDAVEVVSMINASDRVVTGAESFTVERLTSDWNTPKFNLETDTLVMLASDGAIVAYVDVFDLKDPAVRVNCWVCVHPDYEQAGLGPALMDWAEARARHALDRAPQDARVVMDSHVRHRDQYTAELMRRHGFEKIRHALRMERSLDGAIPAPVWPEGIRVRTFRAGKDDRAVTHAIRESFSDHFGYVERPFEEELEFLQHEINDLPIFDPQLWFLAVENDEVAGVNLCFSSAWDDPEMGWVGTLGVRRPWRKRGLGEALLKHAFREFQRLGKLRAGLMVDGLNLTGATRLYEKVGLRAVPSRQYDLYEKVLRTGKEFSVTSLRE